MEQTGYKWMTFQPHVKMDKKQIAGLSLGIFILLGAVGTVWYVTNPEKTFYCSHTEIVGMCFKLSKINADGIQTRCYYNESSPRRYKYCKTGWQKYSKMFAKGNETELPTYVEYIPVTLQTDFQEKNEAEIYIINLKKKVKSEVTITKLTQKPFNNETEVYWNVKIFEESKEIVEECNETEFEIICKDVEKTIRDIYLDETLSSTVPENYTIEDINKVVKMHSYLFVKNWKPQIIIETNVK